MTMINAEDMKLLGALPKDGSFMRVEELVEATGLSKSRLIVMLIGMESQKLVRLSVDVCAPRAVREMIETGKYIES